MPKRKRPTSTFTCPNCGADVPTGAALCPECGSDEETGWSEDAEYDGIDLPEPDDEDFGQEVRTESRHRRTRVLAIVVLLVAMILLGWMLR